MVKTTLKIQQLILIFPLLFVLMISGNAQYKDYKISPKGDTLNAVDKSGLKQGKWVNTIGEIRGEPGYEEEGFYKNDKKTGAWRKYNSTGDLTAIENYLFGGKDGLQEYFSFLGSLEKQEEWRGFNPDAPYDTIAVYGAGNNEIIDYKIVKAEQYSVPNGDWKYFDQNGRLLKMDRYDRGKLVPNNEPAKKETVARTETDKPQEKVKTKEILEYEKKYSKKKRAKLERDGKTAL